MIQISGESVERVFGIVADVFDIVATADFHRFACFHRRNFKR
jgi:hypothetical protein